MKPIYRLILSLLAVNLALGTYAAGDGKNEFNPIETGVTSLSIAPDARGASMGDLGAATDPDANSQLRNPSKYAFAWSQAAVSLNYTPWLRKLVNDIFLADLSGYYKVGSGDNQAVSASLRYFSLGEVNTSEEQGIVGQTLNPYEMSFDVGYSRKLSEKFSMGVVFRYIYSALGFSDSYAGDRTQVHRHLPPTSPVTTPPTLSSAATNVSGHGAGTSRTSVQKYRTTVAKTPHSCLPTSR